VTPPLQVAKTLARRDAHVDEFTALALGVGAAFAFPILAVFLYGRRQRGHNRRMSSRRTEKIRLTRES
jgi:hypothetical protein